MSEGNCENILANYSPPLQASTTLPAEGQFHKIPRVYSLLRMVCDCTEASLDTADSERRDLCPTNATYL